MNAPDRQLGPGIQQPRLPECAVWDFEFLGLMRWLSAQGGDAPPVGEALRPGQEAFRLGQKPSLAFAPREIAEIRSDEAALRIKLFGLGLLGPNGPMPLQFSDFVRDRAEAQQDSTIADFLDMFHHRYLTAFYRAWANNQSAASLDRPDDERFSLYVDRLAGCDANAGARLPPHARLGAAAHLVRETRAPEGMAATWAHYFGVPVAIEEFVPRWISINDEDVSRLGAPGSPSVLGEGTFAGEQILDRQHAFRIVLGPLSMEDYLSFTPSGNNLPLLIEWVRAFIGFEFAWEVELRVKPQAAPGAVIGSAARLGWSSWLGDSHSDEPSTGLVFEPEEGFEG